MGLFDFLNPVAQAASNLVGSAAAVATNTSSALQGAVSSGLSAASSVISPMVSGLTQNVSNYVSPVTQAITSPFTQFAQSGAGVNATILGGASKTAGGQLDVTPPSMSSLGVSVPTMGGSSPTLSPAAAAFSSQPSFNPAAMLAGLPGSVAGFEQGAVNAIKPITNLAPALLPLGAAIGGPAAIAPIVGLGTLGFLQSSNPTPFKQSDVGTSTAVDMGAAVVGSSLPQGSALAAPAGGVEDLNAEIAKYGGTITSVGGQKYVSTSTGYKPVDTIYDTSANYLTSPPRTQSSGGIDGGTTTLYTPYGKKATTEVQNVKVGVDQYGNIDAYQKPFGHSIYNLVSSGSTGAAQSGMFTVGKAETPIIYTQEGTANRVYAPSANIPLAQKVLANPDKYSNQGAEVYGGYVEPLNPAKTVQSMGAQLSTYANPLNLANLVKPEAVNTPKSEMVLSNIPWSVPSNTPAIFNLGPGGVEGAAKISPEMSAVTTAPANATPSGVSFTGAITQVKGGQGLPSSATMQDVGTEGPYIPSAASAGTSAGVVGTLGSIFGNANNEIANFLGVNKTSAAPTTVPAGGSPLKEAVAPVSVSQTTAASPASASDWLGNLYKVAENIPLVGSGLGLASAIPLVGPTVASGIGALGAVSAILQDTKNINIPSQPDINKSTDLVGNLYKIGGTIPVVGPGIAAGLGLLAADSALEKTYAKQISDFGLKPTGKDETMLGDVLSFAGDRLPAMVGITPGRDALTKSGANAIPVASQTYANQLAAHKLGESDNISLGFKIGDEQSNIDKENSNINAFLSGKVDSTGKTFTGTDADFKTYLNMKSQLDSDIAQSQSDDTKYNAFQQEGEKINTDAVNSGVLIKTNDGYIPNPQMQPTQYGEFSQLLNMGGQALGRAIGVPTSAAQYVTYEQTPEFKNAKPFVPEGVVNAIGPLGWVANNTINSPQFGEGVTKMLVTNPQEFANTVGTLAELNIATGGLGSVFEAMSPEAAPIATGILPRATQLIGSSGRFLTTSPIIGGLFVGSSVNDAAGGSGLSPGFNLDNGALVPKVGWGQFQSNLGEQAPGLLYGTGLGMFHGGNERVVNDQRPTNPPSLVETGHQDIMNPSMRGLTGQMAEGYLTLDEFNRAANVISRRSGTGDVEPSSSTNPPPTSEGGVIAKVKNLVSNIAKGGADHVTPSWYRGNEEGTLFPGGSKGQENVDSFAQSTSIAKPEKVITLSDVDQSQAVSQLSAPTTGLGVPSEDFISQFYGKKAATEGQLKVIVKPVRVSIEDQLKQMSPSEIKEWQRTGKLPSYGGVSDVLRNAVDRIVPRVSTEEPIVPTSGEGGGLALMEPTGATRAVATPSMPLGTDMGNVAQPRVLELGAGAFPQSGVTDAVDMADRNGLIKFQTSDKYLPEGLTPNDIVNNVNSINYRFGVNYNEKLPYGDNTFNKITSANSFGASGLTKPSAYAEVFRVMKPGGELKIIGGSDFDSSVIQNLIRSGFTNIERGVSSVEYGGKPFFEPQRPGGNPTIFATKPISGPDGNPVVGTSLALPDTSGAVRAESSTGLSFSTDIGNVKPADTFAAPTTGTTVPVDDFLSQFYRKKPATKEQVLAQVKPTKVAASESDLLAQIQPTKRAATEEELRASLGLGKGGQTQMLGGDWSNYIGNILPSAGKLGEIPEGFLARKGPVGSRGALTPEEAARTIALRYPEQSGMSGYGTESQVIFPGMKGGEHLKEGQAQLTEAEMNLWKNKALYNFAPEQSAITTLGGKVLDYGTVGKVTTTEPMSKEFKNSFINWEDNGDFKSFRNKDYYSADKGVGGVVIHSHPSIAQAFDSGEWGIKASEVPLSAKAAMGEYQERSPSFADISGNGVSLRPQQNVIISRQGATVMEPPVELLGGISGHFGELQYNTGENIKNVFDRSFRSTSKINAGGFNSMDRFAKSEYRKLPLEEKIKFKESYGKNVMAGFAQAAATSGMKVRFVNDINPETGIGTVSGFPEDVMKIASDGPLLDKKLGLNNILGEKIYSGDQLLVKGTNAPEPRLRLNDNEDAMFNPFGTKRAQSGSIPKGTITDNTIVEQLPEPTPLFGGVIAKAKGIVGRMGGGETTRLYRGEPINYYDENGIPRISTTPNKNFFASDIKTADLYANSVKNAGNGMVSYIDVPSDVANAYKQNAKWPYLGMLHGDTFEYVVPDEIALQRKPLTEQVAPIKQESVIAKVKNLVSNMAKGGADHVTPDWYTGNDQGVLGPTKTVIAKVKNLVSNIAKGGADHVTPDWYTGNDQGVLGPTKTVKNAEDLISGGHYGTSKEFVHPMEEGTPAEDLGILRSLKESSQALRGTKGSILNAEKLISEGHPGAHPMLQGTPQEVSGVLRGWSAGTTAERLSGVRTVPGGTTDIGDVITRVPKDYVFGTPRKGIVSDDVTKAIAVVPNTRTVSGVFGVQVRDVNVLNPGYGSIYGSAGDTAYTIGDNGAIAKAESDVNAVMNSNQIYLDMGEHPNVGSSSSRDVTMQGKEKITYYQDPMLQMRNKLLGINQPVIPDTENLFERTATYQSGKAKISSNLYSNPTEEVSSFVKLFQGDLPDAGLRSKSSNPEVAGQVEFLGRSIFEESPETQIKNSEVSIKRSAVIQRSSEQQAYELKTGGVEDADVAAVLGEKEYAGGELLHVPQQVKHGTPRLGNIGEFLLNVDLGVKGKLLPDIGTKEESVGIGSVKQYVDNIDGSLTVGMTDEISKLSLRGDMSDAIAKATSAAHDKVIPDRSSNEINMIKEIARMNEEDARVNEDAHAKSILESRKKLGFLENIIEEKPKSKNQANPTNVKKWENKPTVGESTVKVGSGKQLVKSTPVNKNVKNENPLNKLYNEVTKIKSESKTEQKSAAKTESGLLSSTPVQLPRSLTSQDLAPDNQNLAPGSNPMGVSWFRRPAKFVEEEEEQVYRKNVPGMKRPTAQRQEPRAGSLVRPKVITILGTSIGQGVRTKSGFLSIKSLDTSQRSDVARINDSLRDIGKIGSTDQLKMGATDQMKKAEQKNDQNQDYAHVFDWIREPVPRSDIAQETKQDVTQLPDIAQITKVVPDQKPDQKTTTTDDTKIPPPPIPIPLLGGQFQPGGGTGSQRGGGGKRYREVLQYNFNWQANTAKGGRNINTGGKSSNIGINVPKIGLAVPSKPSGGKIKLNTPVMGKGLMSPKKTVIESSNPSRNLKSSLPKSLKAPAPARAPEKKQASSGTGLPSSLNIGSSLPQKKKGKK